eukprot:Gb_37091 [translate_table: standard]
MCLELNPNMEAIAMGAASNVIGTLFIKVIQEVNNVVNFAEDAEEMRAELYRVKSVGTGHVIDTNDLVQPVRESGFVGEKIKDAQLQLEQWLIRDDNTRVISVYGMGGVGKTSLLKNIYNSKEDLPQHLSVDVRAMKLYSSLKQRKLVLILDDMWSKINLEELGMTSRESGCKIVLSTRSEEVCRSMRTDRAMKMEPLSEEEGWVLFCRGAFGDKDDVNIPRDIEPIAREIAAECKDLPLAIIVVSAAMVMQTDSSEWKFVLKSMKSVDDTFYSIHSEIERDLFQRLKWSYNALPDDLKICFLYFAAFLEDKEIDPRELVEIWIAEGLFKGREHEYLEAKGNSLVKVLRDRCLIELIDEHTLARVHGCKMYDILRDLAIQIGKKEENWFFQAAENGGLGEIPNSFLLNLPSLMVLDLRRTKIKCLPTSIGQLKNLAYLNLSQIGIEDLPESIGDLNRLGFLNLSYCQNLKSLPVTLSALKCLRTLDLYYCDKLYVLPHQISDLTPMERLKLNWSHALGEEEANSLVNAGEQRKEASLKDLKQLRCLRNLTLTIRSPLRGGVSGNWVKMRDLWLSCYGVDQEDLPDDMQAMVEIEYFRLSECNVVRLPDWICEFQNLQWIWLQSFQQLKELPDFGRLPSFRKLWLGGCHKLEELGVGFGMAGAFPMLEELRLCLLPSLVRVCESVGRRSDVKVEEVKSGKMSEIAEIAIGSGEAPESSVIERRATLVG